MLTGRVVAQHVAQLHTGPDAELGERRPQVSVDRVRRHAELRGGQSAAAPGADEVRHPPLSLSESAHAVRGARRRPTRVRNSSRLADCFDEPPRLTAGVGPLRGAVKLMLAIQGLCPAALSVTSALVIL